MEAPTCFKPGYDVARSAPSLYLVSNPVCEPSKEPNPKSDLRMVSSTPAYRNFLLLPISPLLLRNQEG